MRCAVLRVPSRRARPYFACQSGSYSSFGVLVRRVDVCVRRGELDRARDLAAEALDDIDTLELDASRARATLMLDSNRK